VRTNYRASRRGRTRAEFQSKLGTVFEEADECVDWLRIFAMQESLTTQCCSKKLVSWRPFLQRPFTPPA